MRRHPARSSVRSLPGGKHPGALPLGLAACALASACGGVPSSGRDEPSAETAQALTCVTVQNLAAVTAEVDDAQLVTDPTDPTKANTNYGALTSMNTGYVNTDYRRILMKFDLGAAGVPAGAVVSSSTLTVKMIQSLGKNPVDVYAGTASWLEPSVTWNQVASAPGGGLGALLGSMTTLGVANNSLLDVTLPASLVQSWLDPAQNHGVVLDHPLAGRTSFAASEGPSLSRPRLQVCYDVAGCSDGAQNQGETGVDCGGPCGPCSTCDDGVQGASEAGLDCGGASCAACGCAGSACVTHVWSKAFGTPDIEIVKGIAVDGDGSVVITGIYSGTIDLGGGPFTTKGGYDVFLVKLDSQGNHLWSKSFGSTLDQLPTGVTIDGSGNIGLTGTFRNSIDLGGGALTSAGSGDLFLAKLDAQGNHLWSHSYGDALNNASSAGKIAFDGAGNLFLSGSLFGSLGLGGATLVEAGAGDLYVAKFTGGGAHVWSKRFGDANLQYARDLGADAAGNVLVIGEYSGALDLGLGALQGNANDVFLAKLDGAGNAVWNKTFGDADLQYGQGIAVTPAGESVITGYFYGTIDLGDGPVSTLSSTDADAYVARYDAAGNLVYSERFGDSYKQLATDVALDPAGNAVVLGSFATSIDLGGGALSSPAGTLMYVTKLDPTGHHVYSRTFNAASANEELAALDAAGSVLITGDFNSTFEIGGPTFTAAGSADVFLAKLAP